MFYKFFVQLYYWIFRLKRGGLKEITFSDLAKTRSRHLLVLCLVAIIVISNLSSPTNAKNASDNLYKTTLAKLIPSGFGDMEAQILTEDKNPFSVQGLESNGKYINENYFVKNRLQIDTDLNQDSALALLTPDGQAILNTGPGKGNTNNQGTSVTPARTSVTYYEVAKGDTIGTIARKFSISVNTILWANNLSSFSLIRPGDKLTILPSSGVLHVVSRGETLGKIAALYGTSIDQISAANNLGGHLSVGQKIIVPGAKKISSPSVVARRTNNQNTSTGSKTAKAANAAPSGAKMNWPTVGHRITQYFSWRHPGLDIANKVGTPLYAAEAGTVEFAGWATGYGNSVVINHGGGKKTRYGHASKLFVKVGDEVARGENIAAMGNTGWSTGPHLHFEVIISGSKYNPLNYIK